jgi:hypothetical protein
MLALLPKKKKRKKRRGMGIGSASKICLLSRGVHSLAPFDFLAKTTEKKRREEKKKRQKVYAMLKEGLRTPILAIQNKDARTKQKM